MASHLRMRLLLVALNLAAVAGKVEALRTAFERTKLACPQEQTTEQRGLHRAIVHLDKTVAPDPHAFKTSVEGLGRVSDEVHHVYKRLAHGIAGTFTHETLEHILAHEHVIDIEADCMVQLLPDPAPPNTTAGERNVAATQTSTGYSWGTDRIDSRLGVDQDYDSGGLTGEGVRIYILDTGIRTDHVRHRHANR